MVSQGGTIPLAGSVRTGAGQPADATGLSLTIKDPAQDILAGFPVFEPTIEHDGLGEYHYDWTVSPTAALGNYSAIWQGDLIAADIMGTEIIEVVPIGWVNPESSYGGDPAGNIRDAVRFYLGDTDNANLELTNLEVDYLLILEPNSMRAAARGAEVLAAKYAKYADEKWVGPLRLRYTERSARFTALAKSLWRRAASSTVAPYAGGISVTDKEMNEADSDRVVPAFAREMMEYPSGTTSQWDEQT
jgi:hypothetical protein